MEDNKKTISRVMERKQFEGDVEIIIPFHGKHSNVSNLLHSIFHSVYSNRYLVTLVDDASKNDNYYGQIQKANIPNVRILRKNNHGGFGSSVNFALNNPFKFPNLDKVIPYIVIIHSDVLPVSKDWLFNMGSSLERMKSDGVKMVSPLTDNPVDPVDRLVCKERNPDLEDFVLTDDEFLPMYCAISHRDLFKYVNFPELPPHVGLEAKEFASQMKLKGFFQGVCGRSWVHHEGGLTLKTFEKKHRSLRNIAKDQKNN
jgi:GT2 family glycosyltransferase